MVSRTATPLNGAAASFAVKMGAATNPARFPAQTTYLFKNANVVDSAAGIVIPNQRVKISNGRITSVGKNSLAPDDVVVVDLEGKFLCPGLIDCNVNLVPGPSENNQLGSEDSATSYLEQPAICHKMLGRGFTTVRDTNGASLALKNALENEVFPGPHLYLCGETLSQTGGGGHGQPSSKLGWLIPHLDNGATVDGVPACIRAVRQQLRAGADFIKINVGGSVTSLHGRLEDVHFTAEEIKAIVEVAENHGTWVTALAYTPKAIRHAIDNGVKGIEHGNLLDWKTGEYMASKDIWFTPSLVAHRVLGSPIHADRLPQAIKTKNNKILNRGPGFLIAAQSTNVKICHGSGLPSALDEEQSSEFEHRAEHILPAEVLQSATTVAAAMLGQGAFLGQIKEGFAADLLILNENPLLDVSILAKPKQHVLAVIKNGRVCVSRWSKLTEDFAIKEDLIE